MAADLNNEKLIERYLLGDLSEVQQIELEDRAFGDPELVATITAVENDLIDEYVREELSEADRRKFESRFLASASRRQRVEFARALTQVGARAVAPEKTLVRPAAAWSWRDSLYAFISGLNPATRFATVAVMLLILIGGAWLLLQSIQMRRQRTQLQAENQTRENDRRKLEQQIEAERKRNEELNARQNQEKQREQSNQSLPQLNQTEEPTPPRSLIASLTLLPGISRGGGAKPNLVLTDDVRQVRLNVGIDPEEQYKIFTAQLWTVAGNQVWSGRNLTAKSRGKARAVGLTLPASVLKSGEYELRLSGLQEGGGSDDVGFYYFGVKKR